VKPINLSTSRQRLDHFNDSYDKGRGWVHQALWFATLNLLFRKWWLPAGLRPPLLRIFGADVGKNVFIRHNVRVQWPWKLRIGDSVWIGEGAWLINLSNIVIGDNVCISQEAVVCTGGHDPRDASFGFANGEIVIGSGAWLGMRSFIRPGSRIGVDACIAAGTIAPRTVPENVILRSASDTNVVVQRYEGRLTRGEPGR
jgi:putative colanic acid biosynthesis acetyltransferase WcaF